MQWPRRVSFLAALQSNYFATHLRVAQADSNKRLMPRVCWSATVRSPSIPSWPSGNPTKLIICFVSYRPVPHPSWQDLHKAPLELDIPIHRKYPNTPIYSRFEHTKSSFFFLRRSSAVLLDYPVIYSNRFHRPLLSYLACIASATTRERSLSRPELLRCFPGQDHRS